MVRTAQGPHGCSGQHCYRHVLMEVLRPGPKEPEGGRLGGSQLSLIQTFY